MLFNIKIYRNWCPWIIIGNKIIVNKWMGAVVGIKFVSMGMQWQSACNRNVIRLRRGRHSYHFRKLLYIILILSSSERYSNCFKMFRKKYISIHFWSKFIFQTLMLSDLIQNIQYSEKKYVLLKVPFLFFTKWHGWV